TYITFSSNKVGIQVALGQHFSFTNPNLDTDFAIYGLSEYIGILNIHTEGMQAHTALFKLFATGNFCTGQTSTQFDFDTFCTHTKGRSNRHFGSTFEVDTVFNLAGNGVTNDHRIQLGSADLEDVDLNII